MKTNRTSLAKSNVDLLNRPSPILNPIDVRFRTILYLTYVLFRSRNIVMDKIKKRVNEANSAQLGLFLFNFCFNSTKINPKIYLAIFPEGTNSNRNALITFKPGAFVAGCPVQPIILRFYGWDTYTWTFSQLGSDCLFVNTILPD